MLLPTSGFAVWMTQHASPASDVYTCITCGAMLLNNTYSR